MVCVCVEAFHVDPTPHPVLLRTGRDVLDSSPRFEGVNVRRYITGNIGHANCAAGFSVGRSSFSPICTIPQLFRLYAHG